MVRDQNQLMSIECWIFLYHVEIFKYFAQLLNSQNSKRTKCAQFNRPWHPRHGKFLKITKRRLKTLIKLLFAWNTAVDNGTHRRINGTHQQTAVVCFLAIANTNGNIAHTLLTDLCKSQPKINEHSPRGQATPFIHFIMESSIDPNIPRPFDWESVFAHKCNADNLLLLARFSFSVALQYTFSSPPPPVPAHTHARPTMVVIFTLLSTISFCIDSLAR